MSEEQAIHAIWELLSVEERPEDLFWCADDGAIQVNCNCSDDLSDISHRAILDAAREVLDLEGIDVRCVGGPWTATLGDKTITRHFETTRTEAIYRAIAWLKGKSE